MKPTAIFLLTLFTFAACKKEVTPQPGPPVINEAAERDFSLSYVNAKKSQVEVIVTDSSANYSLDTLLPVNVMHFLKVYSDQTKFNITTIDNRPDSANWVNVQTFYQVLPDHWNINQSTSEGFYEHDTTGKVNGTIHFYNAPESLQGESFDFGNAFSGILIHITMRFQKAIKRNCPITPLYCFLTKNYISPV